METKQLITFVTLAKKQSYQKASAALNYAPSTLAKQIRVLEEEFNTRLTERKGTHIELTEKGKCFLPYAEKLLEYYNAMLNDLSITPEKDATLRIAGGEPLIGYSFSDMLLDFVNENPKVRTNVEMTCCNNIPKMLQDDETDIGYIHDMAILKPDGLDVIPLYREEICLVATPENPLAKKASVTYGDLNGRDFAFTYGDCSFCAEFTTRMKKNNITPKSVILLGSYVSVLNSVRSGGRISLIPSTSLPGILADGFVRLNWDDEPLLPWVQLLYPDEKQPSFLVEALINRTRKVAEQRIAASSRDEIIGYVR